MTIVYLLIWTHFIADFILQTDRIAINKSSSNKWLLKHATVYGLCFIPFGLLYAFTNMVSHFFLDYITSRITSKLWKAEKRHEFFVVIGLDQAIHVSTLILTISLMGVNL